MRDSFGVIKTEGIWKMTVRDKSKPPSAKPLRATKAPTRKKPPLPGAEELEFAFLELRNLARSIELARTEERRAREQKEALAEKARLAAERVRTLVETSGALPELNQDALAFASGTLALVESSRESAYLRAHRDDFVTEARERSMYGTFVRIKEEPNFAAFLLGEHRLEASKFRTASIERERAIEIRLNNTKARLRYVLNELKPMWEIEF